MRNALEKHIDDNKSQLAESAKYAYEIKVPTVAIFDDVHRGFSLTGERSKWTPGEIPGVSVVHTWAVRREEILTNGFTVERLWLEDVS